MAVCQMHFLLADNPGKKTRGCDLEPHLYFVPVEWSVFIRIHKTRRAHIAPRRKLRQLVPPSGALPV